MRKGERGREKVAGNVVDLFGNEITPPPFTPLLLLGGRNI